MYIVFATFFIALLLVYLDSRGRLPGGMKFAFILLGTLFALHYNYGNDYMSYYAEFLDYNDYSLDLVLTNTVQRNGEMGWALLNWALYQLFGRYGFFALVALIGAFENWAFYQLITRYVPKNDWTCGVAVYLISTSQYLMFMSMLRQGIAVAIIVIGYIFFIHKKKIIPAVLMVLLASLFHGSAIIFIPFCFVGLMKFQRPLIIVAALSVSFLVLWISREAVDAFLGIFMFNETVRNYTDEYSNVSFSASLGIGWVIQLLPFLIALWYLSNKSFDKAIKTIVFLAAMSAMVQPFAQQVHMISRISQYFSIFELVTIPCTYYAIKSKNIRGVFLFLYFLMSGYNFYLFFYTPGWSEFYSTFHTFFEAL